MARTRPGAIRGPIVYSLYYCYHGTWTWRASAINDGGKSFLRGIATAEGKDRKDPTPPAVKLDSYAEAADFPSGDDGCYAIAEFGTLDGETCTCT